MVFVLIFISGAFFSGKSLEEISNIWSIVASAVNIVTILLLVFSLCECYNYPDKLEFGGDFYE